MRITRWAAAGLLCAAASAAADERLIVEDFDAGFNPRYTHVMEAVGGLGPVSAIRTGFGPGPTLLPSPALGLTPGSSTLTWDATGMGGDQVHHAGAKVWNHDAAAPAQVIFEGAFAVATFTASAVSAGYETFEVTNDTLGERPAPLGPASLGPILSITLHSPGDASFDDIFVSIIHKHCPCDFNQDNDYDVFDLLAYLNQWFLADESADFNEDEAIDVFDLLDFLNCWFDPAGSGIRFCP